ncbi:MAG: ABC transporter permease subunit [Rhodobacteraceae bacterium]|nr:ABC transporter permease subunit [Paracoccaceae bacterium]
MAMADQPAGKSFRLSMLLYDTRYRSMTIQFIMLALFVFGVFWLLNNMYTNLAAANKNPDFAFLSSTAGYDINQRLIEYTSQSTNARAWLVGLLNTLLVAFLGCILATVIGISVGVLRLSKNWIVARLMTVYIEIFRNVPVLLWIVFLNAILSETLPQPKDFKGVDAVASMSFWDTVIISNRGIFVPEPVFLSGSSIMLYVLLASIVGIFAFGRWARTDQETTGRILPTFWIKLAIFVVPTLIVYFMMGQPIDWKLPAFEGRGAIGPDGVAYTKGIFRIDADNGIHIRRSLIALCLALSLYTAAFIAEAVRAGIMAIDKGQSEAAGALGLRQNRVMSLVVLPQALRVIIPPLISQYLNLTKNSSLAIAVGYMDVAGTLGGITLNQTGRALECILLLMITYLTISLSISLVMNLYNNSVKLKER